MDGLTLLVGGARSGKSRLAVSLAGRAADAGSAVAFIATAEPLDEDMSARIRKHREERPPSWTTIEAPHDLANAIDGARDAFVIVDCLTLWVANRLLAGAPEDDVEHEAERLAVACATRSGGTVVVTNEVGMGIVPDNALARTYRDVLGRVNTLVATHAHAALLVVAGRVLPLLRFDDVFPSAAELRP